LVVQRFVYPSTIPDSQRPVTFDLRPVTAHFATVALQETQRPTVTPNRSSPAATAQPRQSATTAPAANPSGVVLQYRGQYQAVVEMLLAHVGGWTVSAVMAENKPPIIPSSFVCQRDSYVFAAAGAAWGIEAEVATGHSDRVQPILDSLLSNLRKVPPLCGEESAASGGQPCATAWLTCDWIKRNV
jgi:hypothetical protein